MDLCTLTENGFLNQRTISTEEFLATRTHIINIMGNKPAAF